MDKRYNSYAGYFRKKYGERLQKLVIDAGFTCPNRDGTVGTGGCSYCDNAAFHPGYSTPGKSIAQQLDEGISFHQVRYRGASHYLAYFQSFSNTYGPLEKIRAMLSPFLEMEEVAEIAIATRCDCLEEETVVYLDEVSKRKPLWLELGLQTSNDRTGDLINRCYTFNDLVRAVERLNHTSIKVCIHVMNGLPYETKEDMLQTVRDISRLPFHGIKIHMLHVLKDTALGEIYLKEPFPLLQREEYIELVVRQLELLKEDIVVQRLTGDPIKEELLAPEWLLNKTTILNDIDKLMRKENTWQGRFHE
jgi:radical SAM protein (TIGR01212 family)